MDEVFISYKRERRNAASHLAKILKCYGYTVWYDYSLVKGEDFADQIDAKIKEAKAAVVLWCSRSVHSKWVRYEAALAAERGILVPAKIEPCELRVDFRSKDYVDLTDWKGSPRDQALDSLLDAIRQKVGRNPQSDYEALREYEEDWRRFDAPPLKAFALGAPVEDRDELQPSPQVSANTQAQPLDAEFQQWQRIRAETDPNFFEDFLVKHPQGSFAAQAVEQASKCISACSDTLPLARLLVDFPQSSRTAQVQERLFHLLDQKMPHQAGKQKSEKPSRIPWIAAGLIAAFTLAALILLDRFPWRDLLDYAGFGIVMLSLPVTLILLIVYLPRAYQISEYLTLAERDLNDCLRGNAQPPVLKQFDALMAMLKDVHPSVKEELTRFRQIMAEPSGRARTTAFLLRELYEVNVQNAQLKIYNDFKNGEKPYIAPGIRQLLDYERFDGDLGFPAGSGVESLPLLLAVKLLRHPRNILMVKPDETVLENWAAINELTMPTRPTGFRSPWSRLAGW